MELKYKPAKLLDSESFYVERKRVPYFGSNWHYHEEHELFYAIKGEGLRIIGDNMNHFSGSELVMIGSGLPHLYKNHEKDKNSSADYIIVKFTDQFRNTPLLSLPEFTNIANFINLSKRGIIFSESTINKVKKPLIKLAESTGADRIINLLVVLKILSEETNNQFIASEDFHLKIGSKGEGRIQKVIDFIGDNYYQDITLEGLAEVANMTTNSFCRYFKSRTGKTAFEFIREYRVNKACQMLINGKKTITDICFDTGFNSFSSFNRIFKNLKNISATEYKNKYVSLKE